MRDLFVLLAVSAVALHVPHESAMLITNTTTEAVKRLNCKTKACDKLPQASYFWGVSTVYTTFWQ
jgi:hypothetical protein